MKKRIVVNVNNQEERITPPTFRQLEEVENVLRSISWHIEAQENNAKRIPALNSEWAQAATYQQISKMFEEIEEARKAIFAMKWQAPERPILAPADLPF